LQSHLYLMHSTLSDIEDVYATRNECKMITGSFSTESMYQRGRTDTCLQIWARVSLASKVYRLFVVTARCQVAFLFSRLSFLHVEISLRSVTTKGTATGAKRGVYTAYLCSAGKYSNANIPGLKNAREASVSARLESCRADAGTLQIPAYSL